MSRQCSSYYDISSSSSSSHSLAIIMMFFVVFISMFSAGSSGYEEEKVDKRTVQERIDDENMKNPEGHQRAFARAKEIVGEHDGYTESDVFNALSDEGFDFWESNYASAAVMTLVEKG